MREQTLLQHANQIFDIVKRHLHGIRIYADVPFKGISTSDMKTTLEFLISRKIISVTCTHYNGTSCRPVWEIY